MKKDKFEEGKIYSTEATHLLNQLILIRNKLNSMYRLDYNDRRDMAQVLYLLELSMVEED